MSRHGRRFTRMTKLRTRTAAGPVRRQRYTEAIGRLRVLLHEDPHDLDCLGSAGRRPVGRPRPRRRAAHRHHGDRARPRARPAPPPGEHRLQPARSAPRGHRRTPSEAVRLAPAEHRAFIVLARALLRAKRDLPRARRSAVQAIVLAPDESEPHLVFGMVSSADREHAAAEAAFQRALTARSRPALRPATNSLASTSGGPPGAARRHRVRPLWVRAPEARGRPSRPPPEARHVARVVRARLSRRPGTAENLAS